jgi:hypothetical protein
LSRRRGFIDDAFCGFLLSVLTVALPPALAAQEVITQTLDLPKLCLVRPDKPLISAEHSCGTKNAECTWSDSTSQVANIAGAYTMSEMQVYAAMKETQDRFALGAHSGFRVDS